MSIPDISVIMPTWNRAKYLPSALRTISNQTIDAKIEVVIADDGSTDDTAEVVRRITADWPKNRTVQYLPLSRNGVCAARNAALAASTAPIVAFLDSDDEWEEGKLEAQIALLSDEVGLVHTDFRYIDSEGRLTDSGPQRPNNPASGECLNALLAEDTVLFSSVLVRRAIIDEVVVLEPHRLPFDPQWSNGQDYDLLLRIGLRTQFGYVSVPLTRYRMHDSQNAMGYLSRAFRFHCRVQMAFAERHCQDIGGLAVGRDAARQFLLGRTKAHYWKRQLSIVRELCDLADELQLSNEEFSHLRRLSKVPMWLLRTKDSLDRLFAGKS